MCTRNIDTVKEIYEAFDRGDVPSILEHFSEDFAWEHSAIKFLAGRQGMEITRLEVKHVVSEDQVVLGLVDIDFTLKSTGKKIQQRDVAHVWHFNAHLRVVSFSQAGMRLPPA